MARLRGEVPVEHGDREQCQAGHEQAGDGAGAEGQRQALLQALGSGCRGAHVGAHRDVHADIAGNARQDCPDQEADGAGNAEEIADQHGDDHADHGDGAVLATEIGLSAFLDGAGDFLHLFIAGI